MAHGGVRHRIHIFVATILWRTHHAPQKGKVGAPHNAFSLVVKKSSTAVSRSAINKINAGKKQYHHRLGTGGYKTAVPKWEAFEAGLLAKGITPQTMDWPERSKFWMFAHGAVLDEETGLIVAHGRWKKKSRNNRPEAYTCNR